jgi:UDP-GlcNAc:undecaprenyl-phosphate/decaprenyl-phosphate GlcNAc-1-phosphate transferase
MIDPGTLALTAFVLSLTLTLLAERVARRAGVVARPAADRWHRGEVPLLGGVAIVVATLVPLLGTAHGRRDLVILSLTALAMGLVGLIDDVQRLSPQAKVLAQTLLGAVLLHFGFVLHLTGFRLVDMLVTLFWIIGITNAFNLLDNMDGLSATIAIVAAGFRLLFFVWEGDDDGIHAAVIFAGAVAGFLVRNFAPAKIFMGDAGSLFLGFFLSGLCLIGAQRAYSRGVVAVLVIPVLLLLIPIFDTAFVTATRLLAGVSPAAGGRDHTSHRLVAIGLTERQTVLLLALISAAAGGVAVLSYRVGLSRAVVLLALLVIGLVLLGIHLSRVKVVHTVEARDGGTILQVLADFQYKRQVMTLGLDVCLILVAYYAAYVIRFEGTFDVYVEQLYDSLPVVLLVQLVTLAAFGLYRGIWQYTGLSDAVRIVKAVTLGTMIAVIALVYTDRFVGFSRTVFILDWLLLIVLLGGSRLSFRLLTEVLRPRPAAFRRVLIYGAGDGGELIVREILNNPELQRVPVGFIDDDRAKHLTRIHGLPVLGSSDQLEAILSKRPVTEIIVSSVKIPAARLASVAEVCRGLEVRLKRASFHLE